MTSRDGIEAFAATAGFRHAQLTIIDVPEGPAPHLHSQAASEVEVGSSGVSTSRTRNGDSLNGKEKVPCPSHVLPMSAVAARRRETRQRLPYLARTVSIQASRLRVALGPGQRRHVVPCKID